jgi:hypothetical protein
MTPRIHSVDHVERDYTKNAPLGMEGRFAVLRSAQLIFERIRSLYRLAFFFAFLALGIIFFAAFFTAALADLTNDLFFDFLAMVFPFAFLTAFAADSRYTKTPPLTIERAYAPDVSSLV